MPTNLQEEIKRIDTDIANDDLSCFDRRGWAYFVDIDHKYTALGNVRKDPEEFYWTMLGSPETMPGHFVNERVTRSAGS